MGAAASLDSGLSSMIGGGGGGTNRYFCHSCYRVLQLDSDSDSDQDNLHCPHCQSSFLEEIGPTFVDRPRNHGQLTLEQARRIANATVMLRLLESQLREELDLLQQAFEQANLRMGEQNQPKRNKLTKVMKGKLRSTELDLDMICSQPSCPICSEDYTVGCRVLKLPCTHYFHRDCVFPWLEMKQNCPICRSELSNTLPTPEEIEKLTILEIDEQLRDLNVEIEGVDTKKKEDLEKLLLTRLRECHEDDQSSANNQGGEDLFLPAINPIRPFPLFTLAFRNRASLPESGRSSNDNDSASSTNERESFLPRRHGGAARDESDSEDSLSPGSLPRGVIVRTEQPQLSDTDRSFALLRASGLGMTMQSATPTPAIFQLLPSRSVEGSAEDTQEVAYVVNSFS